MEIPERSGHRSCGSASCSGKRSVTEFNYRYRRSQGGAAVRRPRARPGPRRSATRVIKHAERRGLRGARHDRQRDGEAARALHGRRPRARTRATSGCTASSFPERPGALLKFLRAIGTDWNISLFHYRNHGSDYGRVLAGIQVPPRDADGFPAAPQRAAVRVYAKRPTIRPTRFSWSRLTDEVVERCPALLPGAARAAA